MNALHELQRLVTNDLRMFRYNYFPGRTAEIMHSGFNHKRGGKFEEIRYRLDSLDFFDGYMIIGNVGGEKPSDYAKSVHYHNLIMQGEGVKGIAYGFDVEPVFGEDGRPAASQHNFSAFMDAVMRNSKQFLLLHVTDPYKISAYNYCSTRGIEMTESARISGVVNPFIFGKGAVYADNVDGYALMQAIENKRQVKGSRVLIIGAGGVGSSIALEAASRLADEIVILNRTEQRAHELAKRLASYVSSTKIVPDRIDVLEKYAPDTGILISAITENPYVTEEIARFFPPETLFADVNYGNSAAVATAGIATSHDAMDGVPMVYYGVERAARLAFRKKLEREIDAFTLEKVKHEAGLR